MSRPIFDNTKIILEGSLPLKKRRIKKTTNYKPKRGKAAN